MSHKRLLITVLSIVVVVAMALLRMASSSLAQDGGYKEAPMLAAKVAAGELPPLRNACRQSRVVEPFEYR